MIPSNKKSEQISFRLSEALKKRIDIALIKTQRKQSNFIEIGLDYYLKVLENNNYIEPKPDLFFEKEKSGVAEPGFQYTVKQQEEINKIQKELNLMKEILCKKLDISEEELEVIYANL